MSSSISSSDAPGWRRFAAHALAWAAAPLLLVAAFVIVVDPFDTLPLSPAFDRPPVATNARYSFPALARSAGFDSVIVGTSTSRLLRPAVLDPLFAARFANLAMNSAMPYEQMRLLDVFLRHHPAPRAVMVGLDTVWCSPTAMPRRTERGFPEWMYDDNPWNDLPEHFNLYTVEQAGQQFAILTGLKKARYGRDGYTNFLPDDSLYDPARVSLPAVAQQAPAAEAARRDYPDHALLKARLEAAPAGTLKLLYFVPYYLGGFAANANWAACKQRIAEMADAIPNTVVADFMIDSPITREPTNYWDPLHYREPVAERLMRGLAAAAVDPALAVDAADFRLLAGERVSRASL